MKELIKKFIPEFVLSWYHFGWAFLGALLYGFPSGKLKVIGVTGTNGKTTVVNMAAQILEAGGFKTAALSSVSFKIAGKETPNLLRMTMPGRFTIQKFLKTAVDQGCTHAVLEVSSEGIKQHRHCFINFDTAVFTNLTPEHIEAHHGFENYKKAKGKLFQATKNIHIINLDDANADYFWRFPAQKKYGYRLTDYPDLRIQLPGDFNKYNAIAAINVGLSQGVDLDQCLKAIQEFKGVSGRMETIIQEPFRVVVDYAFTPNALEQVYKTLKTDKLICVLGACGGGRDKWKRPVLGQIAGKYCDEIIITNEDPYDEDPMEIIDQVAQGTAGKAKKILNRKDAIKESLRLAQSGDTVVITGKGCEPWIYEARGKKTPWDDRRVVKEEYSTLINLQKGGAR